MATTVSLHGLHIAAATRTEPARATFECACGHYQRAHGVPAVVELVSIGAAAHRETCPLRPDQETVPSRPTFRRSK